MPFSELKTYFSIDNFNKLIRKTFELDVIKAAYLDILQKRLYDNGTDADKKRLISKRPVQGGVYAKMTVKEKKKKGQKISNVTLFDTGDFYNSFIISVQNKAYLVKADYEKKDGNIYRNFNHLYKTFLEFDRKITDLQEDEWNVFIEKIFLPQFEMVAMNELFNLN